MNLIGLLSFYDEAADWLTAAIASHKKCGLTHLIAVDGAYFLYPNGRARSGIEQHQAITSTCEALDIGCTIHAPNEVWVGNETEKRSFMFALGLTIAQPTEDWFVVIDADHLCTDSDHLHRYLEQTDRHAAEITVWERPDPTTPEARQFAMPRVHQSTVRMLYRANPGLRCDGNHYTYIDGQGRTLWGQDTPKNQLVPTLDLTHVKIEHRTKHRDVARHQDQARYYRLRDELHTERQTTACDWTDCDQPIARTVAYNFEPIPGSAALQAGSINVCAKHLKRAHYENRDRLTKLGHDYGHEGELLKRH